MFRFGQRAITASELWLGRDTNGESAKMANRRKDKNALRDQQGRARRPPALQRPMGLCSVLQREALVDLNLDRAITHHAEEILRSHEQFFAGRRVGH